MTIRTKRRGRRSLAAILAAMLMASVLAVVAGSPAQAANTSFEVKTDHDNNAATDMVREFAGQDRYDTALRLAKNFAQSKGGLGAVPNAFVSSGETLIDSISVAGLAGYVDAPILLTPSGSLHGGVADFIEDYGVSTVYVLGGSAAVADSVAAAIEGLDGKPKVMRVAGDDRYATAAATASMIDANSSWCGTDAVSAVLINGSSDMLSYGVAVQTIAYRLQLPVLMTAADELPDATAEFITENDVEHVEIIGGTGAVSAEVEAALTTLGVDTVARVAGDSAAAVSVELAKMAGNGCSDSLGLVSNNRVALVRGNPDGVVAAPVLSSSLESGLLVPPLVVGDSLPASVRDYLAATP
uniref:cell wall-binding repeat-containing protein n=1 Tax=Candidatus Poriferisodalis sp. TaxID=3101277 RepID=UPI003B021BD3